MTAMTHEQRDAYAPPGSMTRRAIDLGFCDWPTVEEAEYEDMVGSLLSTGHATLPTGATISFEDPQ